MQKKSQICDTVKPLALEMISFSEAVIFLIFQGFDCISFKESEYQIPHRTLAETRCRQRQDVPRKYLKSKS